MDDASRSEIINILRLDATNTLEMQKGKQPASMYTDQDLALHAWEEEVNRYARLEEDHRMAMSIARAVQTDRQLVTAAQAEEERAAEDRRLAMRLAGNGQMARARAQGAFASNRSAVARAPPIVTLECVACTESTPSTDTIQTPCSHYYCRSCATKLFEDSLKDESLFPPRCCRTPVPLTLVQRFLTPDISRQFEEKLVEHNDPNRTYCSNATCSRYLRAAGTLGSNNRFCAQCYVWTCVLCKKGHMPGRECPDDNEEVLHLGRERGWQRCPRCKNLVELTTGCNHITCRCQNQFCYSCGIPWKGCECPQWDEDNLLDHAQNVLNRNNQPGQGQALQRMARHLRGVHECDHDVGWRRVGGGHRCEECRNFLPRFILECEECQLRACNRCRHNRL